MLTSTYPVGRLKKITNGTASQLFTYNDPLGRVTRMDQVFASAPTSPYTFTYTYFPFGGLNTYTFPSTRQLQYHYDDAGRLKTLDGTAAYRYADLSATSAYAPHGGIANMNRAAGTFSEVRHYNPRLQITSIADSFGAAEQWYIQNTYSSTANNGNVTAQLVRRFGATTWTRATRILMV